MPLLMISSASLFAVQTAETMHRPGKWQCSYDPLYCLLLSLASLLHASVIAPMVTI